MWRRPFASIMWRAESGHKGRETSGHRPTMCSGTANGNVLSIWGRFWSWQMAAGVDSRIPTLTAGTGEIEPTIEFLDSGDGVGGRSH